MFPNSCCFAGGVTNLRSAFGFTSLWASWRGARVVGGSGRGTGAEGGDMAGEVEAGVTVLECVEVIEVLCMLGTRVEAMLS